MPGNSRDQVQVNASTPGALPVYGGRNGDLIVGFEVPTYKKTNPPATQAQIDAANEMRDRISKAVGTTVDIMYPTKSGARDGSLIEDYNAAPVGFRFDNGQSQYVGLDLSGNVTGVQKRTSGFAEVLPFIEKAVEFVFPATIPFIEGANALYAVSQGNLPAALAGMANLGINIPGVDTSSFKSVTNYINGADALNKGNLGAFVNAVGNATSDPTLRADLKSAGTQLGIAQSVFNGNPLSALKVVTGSAGNSTAINSAASDYDWEAAESALGNLSTVDAANVAPTEAELQLQYAAANRMQYDNLTKQFQQVTDLGVANPNSPEYLDALSQYNRDLAAYNAANPSGTAATTSDTTALDTNSISALNALGTAQLAALTTADISALNPVTITGVNGNNLITDSNLPVDRNVGTTTGNILTNVLVTGQREALTTDDINALITGGISALKTDQISALNQVLVTGRQNVLNTVDINAFNTRDLVALTSDQLSALNQVLVTGQKEALVTSALDTLTTSDLTRLVTSQIPLLTSNITALNSVQISALHSCDVGYEWDPVLKACVLIPSLTTSDLTSLTTSQIPLATAQLPVITVPRVTASVTPTPAGALPTYTDPTGIPGKVLTLGKMGNLMKYDEGLKQLDVPTMQHWSDMADMALPTSDVSKAMAALSQYAPDAEKDVIPSFYAHGGAVHRFAEGGSGGSSGSGAAYDEGLKQLTLPALQRWSDMPDAEMQHLAGGGQPDVQAMLASYDKADVMDALKNLGNIGSGLEPLKSKVFQMGQMGTPSQQKQLQQMSVIPQLAALLQSRGMKLAEGGQPDDHTHPEYDGNPVFRTGGLSGLGGKYVEGKGDGTSDDITAMLANGEYVFSADVVSALGNGSNKAGAEELDHMVQAIRSRARSAPPDKLPPDAKSPLEYLKSSKGKKHA